MTALHTISAPENPDKGENPSSMAVGLEFSPFSPLPGPGVQTERMRAAQAALEAARAYRRPQPQPTLTRAVVRVRQPTPTRGNDNRPGRLAVPDDWARGVANLATMPSPGSIVAGRWRELARTSARLLNYHGAALHGAGWAAIDLFGLHGLAPATCAPGWGLAWLLGAHGEVLDVAADAVGMRWHPGGARMAFRRRPVTAGVVAAWSIGNAC